MPVMPTPAMTVSKTARASGRPSGASSPNQTKRIHTERNYTLDEAKRFIAGMPTVERNRINAVLDTDSFADAARLLGCDPETISRTWKKYKRMIKIVALDVNATTPTTQSS